MFKSTGHSRHNRPCGRFWGRGGFSLAEIMVALGIFSFAVMGIVALFSVGIQSSGESEEEIQAANMATMILETRRAAPSANSNALLSFAIPASALVQPFGPAYENGATSYINSEGKQTSAASALYRITCRAGTTALTGTGIAQVHLILSWPPQTDPSLSQTSRYEIITQMPNR